MAEIDKPNSHLTTVKWRFPSVHPEGRKFTLIAAFLTLATYTMISHFLGWLLVLLTIWVAAFFRDPIRTTPQDPDLIVAPADGLVTMISRVSAPPELAGDGGLTGEFTRVSIFMSVFDVHINRTPIAGTVSRIAYVPGKFLNAAVEKSSLENEQSSVGIASGSRRILVRQIAGLIARRIVTYSHEGDQVQQGERMGLIRFGSRVDLFIPTNSTLRVRVGETTSAGTTVIAELPAS